MGSGCDVSARSGIPKRRNIYRSQDRPEGISFFVTRLVEVGHKYLSKNGRCSAQVLWGVNAVLPSSQGRERGSKLALRKVSSACVVHLFLSWTSEEHCVIFTTEDVAWSHA